MQRPKPPCAIALLLFCFAISACEEKPPPPPKTTAQTAMQRARQPVKALKAAKKAAKEIEGQSGDRMKAADEAMNAGEPQE